MPYDINVAAGGNAEIQKQIESEQKLMLEEQRRARRLLNEKNERAAKKYSTTTTAQFTSKELATGVFPGQEYEDIHAGLPDASAALGGLRRAQIERRAEAAAAVRAADAADSSSADSAALSLKDLGLKAVGVTAALGMLEKTIGGINARQREAADSKLSLDERMAASGQALGLTPEESKARRLASSQHEAMTAEQAAALQSAVAESSSKIGPAYGRAVGVPLLSRLTAAVNEGRLSFEKAMSFAGRDPSEGTAALAGYMAQSGRQAEFGPEAALARVAAQRPIDQAQDIEKWRGQALNKIKAEWAADETKGEIFLPWLFPETRQRDTLQRRIAEGRRNIWDSGRSGWEGISNEEEVKILKEISNGVSRAKTPSSTAGQ